MSDVLDKPTGPVEAYRLPSGDDEINAILNRLDGHDADDDPVPPQYAPDPEPQPKPKTDTPPAPDPGGDGSAPAPPPTEAEAAGTPVTAEDLASASTLLARMKIPPSVLKDMTDQQKIAWAKDLEPVQSETANAYRELGELKKLASAAANGTQSVQRPEASAAPGEPVVNPKVNLAERAKAFGESFGEDAVPALLEPLQAMQEWTEQTLSAMRAENDGLRATLLDVVVGGARRELMGDFPQLADPEKFASVQKLASALAQTGEYEDATSLLRKASEVTFAGQIVERAVHDRTSILSQRSLGQPEVPQPSRDPVTGAVKPMSPEDRDAYALELIDKGASKEEVIKALAKLP